MISVWARYCGGFIVRCHENYRHEKGDLCEMHFFDVESARLAFAVAGRGTGMEVTDDEGWKHFPINTLCGFSTCQREMELRGRNYQERSSADPEQEKRPT